MKKEKKMIYYQKIVYYLGGILIWLPVYLFFYPLVGDWILGVTILTAIIWFTACTILFMLNDPDGKEVEIPEPSQSSGAEAGPEVEKDRSSTSQRS